MFHSRVSRFALSLVVALIGLVFLLPTRARTQELPDTRSPVIHKSILLLYGSSTPDFGATAHWSVSISSVCEEVKIAWFQWEVKDGKYNPDRVGFVGRNPGGALSKHFSQPPPWMAERFKTEFDRGSVVMQALGLKEGHLVQYNKTVIAGTAFGPGVYGRAFSFDDIRLFLKEVKQAPASSWMDIDERPAVFVTSEFGTGEGRGTGRHTGPLTVYTVQSEQDKKRSEIEQIQQDASNLPRMQEVQVKKPAPEFATQEPSPKDWVNPKQQVWEPAGQNVQVPADAGEQVAKKQEQVMFLPRDGFAAIYAKQGILGIIGQLLAAVVAIAILLFWLRVLIGMLSGVDDQTVGALLLSIFLKKR